MTDLVLTLIGLDRPGLVESVAQVVADHGGNWLESRMIHLGGHFAGILRVEVPPDRRAPLSRALDGLAASGLRVVADDAAPNTSAPPAAEAHRAQAGSPTPGRRDDGRRDDGRLMKLELVGLDRPGLVREISQVLAQHGINVEELSTGRTSAPMSGEMLFRAEARVKIPAGVEATGLRARIERLASDLTVEIKLDETE